MAGEAIYQHTLVTMRNRGHGPNGSKDNSRKWAESDRGIQIGEDGGDWKTISIIQWRLYLKDAFAMHVLASPFGIYEILMGDTRELDPRKGMGIGATGNAGVASISVMVETIE